MASPEERGHRNVEVAFWPEPSDKPLSGRMGWRPTRHRPIDRARKGLAEEAGWPEKCQATNELINNWVYEGSTGENEAKQRANLDDPRRELAATERLEADARGEGQRTALRRRGFC